MSEIGEQHKISKILSIPAENCQIEFKRLGAEFKVAKITDTVVAMANTDGGDIILGVDDPEQTKLKDMDRIFGIEENPEKYDELIRNIQRISPPIPVSNTKMKCPNSKTIVVIRVDKAVNEFHSINNHVFIRLEKGNKLLTPYEIVELSYAKGFQRADRELVDVHLDLLETEYYARWKDKRGLNGGLKEILFRTGLAKKDEDGRLIPTRSAVLLFAQYPHELMDTKCTIRIFIYQGREERVGTTLNLLGTPETIHGPVIRQIQRAHDRVLTLLRSGIKMPSSSFITAYTIPERALTEAITNAVIHRDYYIKRDIAVNIFEDRVTVSSPGLFPFNITVGNIGNVRSSGCRNDLLVKHLREFPEPPNLDINEGVQAMRAEMNRCDLYPPVFMTYPRFQDSVNVLLYNETRPQEWDKLSQYLTTGAKYAMNQDVRRILGIPDVSKVSRLLKRWVDQGLLIKPDTGSRKVTKYRLPENIDLFA